MKKALRIGLITTGVAGLLYGLYRFYDKQVSFIKNIQWEISNVTVKNLDFRLLSLEITVRVFNASNIEATVKEIFLDFFVNNIPVGNIQEAKDMVIMPGKASDVTFTFNFNPQLALQNVVNIVSLTTSLKDLKFSAKGFIKIKSSFITKTLPYEYQTSLKDMKK
jgi:LEA14-like dessication related protein